MMGYSKRIEEIRSRLPVKEIRFTSVQPRAGSVRVPDGPGVLRGYGAIWNEWSEDLGGFRERIAPGAFAKSLRENPDILICYNHDPSKLIGRTSAGTASVVEDSVGFLVSANPVDTAIAGDVIELIKTKHVRGMSFAFSTVDDFWWENDGETFRELRELRLYEVGPVTVPAYPATLITANGGRAVQQPTEQPIPGPTPTRERVTTPTPLRDGIRQYREKWKQLDAIRLGRPEPGSEEDLELEIEVIEECAIEAFENGDADRGRELMRRHRDVKNTLYCVQNKGKRDMELLRWPPRSN